ncbi:MAG: arabinose ABC transporter permease [Nitrospirales bacterium]|nr:arabinose ABC transporter permease [Nitrospirales bacterium]
MACASATQDIAIDAYSIQLLDRKELGPGNGIRVTTYRIALIAAGGVFLAVGGVLGWSSTIAGAALLMAGSSLFLSLKLPQIVQPVHQTSDSLSRRVWASFAELFGSAGFVPVALFIVLFKLGDMALGPMIRPFWVDQEFSPVQIGIVPGTIGVVSTIVGALLGGMLTEKWGLYQAMWILGVAQAGSNLVYVLAAASSPSALLMYTASVVESLCGGLGTAPFLAFLMSICNKTFAASQYAILSALFGLTRVVAGSFSGIVTESIGYMAYFSLTVVLAFPAFLLLPFVKHWVAEHETK